MDNPEETMRKKKETELFFKKAFCADSAEVLTDITGLNLRIKAVIKLETKDRGTFFYRASGPLHNLTKRAPVRGLPLLPYPPLLQLPPVLAPLSTALLSRRAALILPLGALP